MESEGMAGLREELLAGLVGDVVEIGAGNGLNFGHYPATVSQVTAIEPEPYLRGLATDRAAHAPVAVSVRAGLADRLPLPDDSVDAAVLCLVMCSLTDRAAALAEVGRVLRPGGVLRFLEHTIAETRGLRIAQWVADATFWPLLAGGCHTATDPAAAITAAGFTITDVRRLRFPESRFTQPSSPHVLGTARISPS
ncbi:class I SAM-dependent methyltransferase [Pseudonocardia sp. GCM10023141]|uniref:class I SAM-dependent methyltransferase n=1 Tax=Pseudonocardia sp. GCM10023141 TaxID=3252653 RepID=UPI0036215247